MIGTVLVNKSGGGLVVKTLHQCVLQTQARGVVPPTCLGQEGVQHDDAETVSSNLTRRII